MIGTDAPSKPKFGERCNGCGHCCQQQACDLSVKYLKSTVAPCIALEHEDGRYWCGFVRNPGKYLGLPEDLCRTMLSPTIAFTLALGAGCDAADD